MSDDIEILPPEEVIAEDNAAPRKGVGLPLFAIGLLLASALGAAGGGAIAYSLKANPADLSPLRAEIAQAQGEVSDLRAAQARLDRTIKTRPAAQSVDLSPLERRLAALENAPAPSVEIPDIDPEALAQLKAAQEAGFEWPNADALEDKIDALKARVAALENQPRSTISVPIETEIAAPITAVMPFPKQALLEAVEDSKDGGNFFERTMRKHVRVKDGSDPRVIIEAIEAATARGDIDTAKAQFDQLPSQIRSAGRDWRNGLDRS